MANRSFPDASAHFSSVGCSCVASGLKFDAAYWNPAWAASMFVLTTAGFFANVVSSTDSRPLISKPIRFINAPTATVFCMTGSRTAPGASSGTGSGHNCTPGGGS